MRFSRLFKGMSKPQEGEATQPTLNQGIYYLYLIIFLQVVFVLGLVTVIMVAGKVLATPMWVFLLAIGLGVWGCVHIYKKAKRQLRKLREALQRVDLSDRNYQISFMGGFLTMRVEQPPRQHLLEAPPAQSPPMIEAEPIDTTVVSR
jgi:hypothetical protein